jgi:Putative bacterial sensory transduction regulator
MTEVTSLMGLVERIIEHIEDGTLEAGFEEKIQRGSASGSASVVRDRDDPDGLVLVVRLSLMRVPEDDRGPLFQRLLDLNHELQGRAAFSVHDDGLVYLTSGRPIEDLDPGEVIDLLLWTSEQADYFDDVLLTEFGHDHRL